MIYPVISILLRLISYLLRLKIPWKLIESLVRRIINPVKPYNNYPNRLNTIKSALQDAAHLAALTLSHDHPALYADLSPMNNTCPNN